MKKEEPLIERMPEIESPYSVFKRTYLEIKNRAGKKPELQTGIPSIDNLIYTIPKGVCTTLAGITSHGKSAFLLQMLLHISLTQNKVCRLISLEDSREAFIERLLSHITDTPNTELRKGNIEGLLKEELTGNVKTITDNLVVLDDYGYNFKEFEASVLDIKPMPEIVFVDYIQLIDDNAYKSRLTTLNDFLRECHNFAKKHHIAIVFLSQINREGAKTEKLPKLQQLQGSSRIEQISRLVILLF